MMNKRINKLAQLAGLAWAEDVGCGFPDIKYPPGYEKFAELLIRECAKIADAPSGWQPGYNIKKHFGVEE